MRFSAASHAALYSVPRIRGSRRGMSLVELLVAVLILSIVGAGAAATWSYASKVPANKRVTDMYSILATREIEVVKAKKYLNITTGSTTTYYDRYGSSRDTSGNSYTTQQSLGYIATTVIQMPKDATGTRTAATNTTKDLLEVETTIRASSGTNTFETQRTLLTFGGI